MMIARSRIWLVLCLAGTLLGAVQAEEEVAKQGEMSKKDRDREAILSLAGTFVIDFTFKETVPFEQGYEPKEPYHETALEEVIVDEEGENKIVLQHILQTGGGRVIKHWREDWQYENTALLEYQGKNVWTRREIAPEEAQGTWTQTVFEVSDAPRYSGYAAWIHKGNLSEWESQATNRPLPRREDTKRSDYHILLGTNRIALTQTGWVHEQDNTKIRLTDDNSQEAVVREFGLNSYDLTQEGRCSVARQWWRDNRPFWVDVRAKWDAVFAANPTFQLRDSVDGGPLHEHLFPLGKDSFKDGEYRKAEAVPQIGQWIDKFLAPEDAAPQVGKAD